MPRRTLSLKIEEDGITHINVYSKGATELGRLLSNFAQTPFILGEDRYQSVEGYWFWKITGDVKFRNLYGAKAKHEGERDTFNKFMKYNSEPNAKELKEVYYAKLKYNPKIKEMLLESTLPFEHYYVYEDKIQRNSYNWTAKLWEEIRTELKGQN